MTAPLSVPQSNGNPSQTRPHSITPVHFNGYQSQGEPFISSPRSAGQQRLPHTPSIYSPNYADRPFDTSQSSAGPSRQQQYAHPQMQSTYPNLDAGYPSSTQNTANGSDPRALQARLAIAQQAMHASMQQRQRDGDPEQEGAGESPQTDMAERKASGPTPEWAAVANAMGGMGIINNMQGASKEAILKQLQALHTSHAQRARLGQGVPAHMPQSASAGASAPSPASGSAPSPATPQASAPSSVNAMAGPSTPSQQDFRPTSNLTVPPVGLNGAEASNGPVIALQMTQQQRDFLLTQQYRMRAAQQDGQFRTLPPRAPAALKQAATSPSTPPRPPGQARPQQTVADQRRQFVSSLAAFHKQYNKPLPPEIFNRDHEGAIKLGDTWVQMVDLFMVVMRNKGVANVINQSPDSPLWQNFLSQNHISNPLAEPVTLPRPLNADPQVPPQMTTSPIQYLLTAYMTWLQPFEMHMSRIRMATAQRQASVAGRPPATNGASSIDQNTVQTPSVTSATSPRQVMETPTDTTQAVKPKKHKSRDVPKPAPIKVDIDTSAIRELPDTPEADSGKKRKRDKRDESVPAIPRTGTPRTRERYRVEYRPLHSPVPTLGGWDERAVASTFPKHNLGQVSRSIHELGIVDMEAILMGIRSRLPRELGYALTVLSMLSMPHPEENIGGLPLMHLPELYLELLDLIGEAGVGEEGFEADIESSKLGGNVNKLSFFELGNLGGDPDYSVESESGRGRDRSGGQTDIVLAGLNILRNFSMLPENQSIMASRPELFRSLAAIGDASLCRFDVGSVQPYSILELGRVRRDVVVILTNVGNSISLRSVPFSCTLSVFRLLSTFLSTGWEDILSKESPYGPTATLRDGPPPLVLSINRAVEAFCKLAASDTNREVLARVPPDELVSLFSGLIRLFPSTARSVEAMHTVEDYLGHTESLALSLYSLAFLAPLQARVEMRSVPGAVNILTRIIYDTVGKGYDFKTNPFGVLCRRLCETLGVLNGTVSAVGDVERIGFSSGSGGGKGWRFASTVVEKGWLATEQERLMECLGVRGLDLPAFVELDGMWWAG